MKIFMATMGLGIGGAETHIVELAKELKARGHEVVIASNGGVYVAGGRGGGDPALRRPHAPAQRGGYAPLPDPAPADPAGGAA